IKYTPSSGRYKVYIIDEVHMLTGQAFNALLKTLEEPPAHAKFIFATTAAHDVPATIVSRCQRFDFRRATAGEIKARLVWLAQQERIRATDAALMAIARRADGAIRDAEGILDQLASFRPDGIHLEDVEELLGLVPGELFFDYADLIAGGDAAKLVAFLGRLFEAGYDHQEFYSGVVRHFRNLLVLQMGGGQAQLNLLPDEAARLSDQAAALGRSELLKALSAVMAYETQVGATQHPRALLEVMSLELAWGRAGADAGGKAGNPSAQDQDRHASAPADQTKPMNEVWRELKQRTARRRSVIGSFLELASPVSLEQDTLAILLPRKHQTAAEQIQADLECLHATLSEIRGRATRLAIQVAGQAKPDPTRERITSVLGDVDEKEPN
ncbi:hypothetical protein FJY70_03940, partial [candidate division WOR-3 bacterium]|nr:hypothetical protein [candidate division WOR-3 bacterium]